MNLAKIVSGIILSAALLGGCVTDHNYVRTSGPATWKQNYHGVPPKFMEQPNYVLPPYRR